jgi:hypothetical protein
MTAARALSPAARALLADLQGVNAMGEGSLKSWGSRRRPQLTLTQVEARADELVDAGLVAREMRRDGRAVYRARERSPEPPPASVKKATKRRGLYAPSSGDFVTVESEELPDGRVAYRVKEKPPESPPAPEPGYDWIPNSTGAAGPFYGVDRSPEPKKKAKKSPVVYVNRCAVCGRDDGAPGRCAFCHELGYEEPEAPAPCAECTRLAEALLSWERLWGKDGSDLAAMEARVQEANEERDRALRALAEQLQVTTPPLSLALSPNAQDALAVLSTTRGTSPGEIATRSRILRRSVPHALAELRAAGVAIETTPGLWRRRLWATTIPTPDTPPWRGSSPSRTGSVACSGPGNAAPRKRR